MRLMASESLEPWQLKVASSWLLVTLPSVDPGALAPCCHAGCSWLIKCQPFVYYSRPEGFVDNLLVKRRAVWQCLKRSCTFFLDNSLSCMQRYLILPSNGHEFVRAHARLMTPAGKHCCYDFGTLAERDRQLCFVREVSLASWLQQSHAVAVEISQREMVSYRSSSDFARCFLG